MGLAWVLLSFIDSIFTYMGKYKNAPPEFLQQKLTDSVKKVIFNHLPDYIKSRLKKKKATKLSSKDLCDDFILFLGKKSKQFKGLDPSSFSTHYKGVWQIYDAIRKKLNQGLEERQLSKPTPEKSKSTPPKSAKQIEEKAAPA